MANGRVGDPAMGTRSSPQKNSWSSQASERDWRVGAGVQAMEAPRDRGAVGGGRWTQRETGGDTHRLPRSSRGALTATHPLGQAGPVLDALSRRE